jgi:adenylylsulfate kinase-like enzyme
MSWAIWITGLPGSGKSAIARGAAAQLRSRGEGVVVLELDEIRRVITPAPTYSDAKGMARGVHLVLKTEKESIPAIINAEVKKAGAVLTLREESGFPA